jgi:hypothetical protein
LSASPSIQFEFHLSEIFFNGDWSGVFRPEIFEFFPMGAGDEKPLTAEDPRLKQYERLKRIVITQFLSSRPDELGLGRKYEGIGSNDVFNVVIKAPTFTDATHIFNRLRKIVVDHPPRDYYTRIDFEGLVTDPERGFWYSSFQAVCNKTGSILQDG